MSSVKPRGLWWPYNDGTGSVPMDVGHLSLLARLSAWIICSTHNLTCSEGLLKVSSISGLTGPRRRRHTLMQWFRDPVLPIPEEVCTSVHRCSQINFRTFSPAEYSKHNSWLDLGRMSSVAANQACVVPYLGIILLNCFSKMFKIVQFYCYFFRTVKWSHS